MSKEINVLQRERKYMHVEYKINLRMWKKHESPQIKIAQTSIVAAKISLNVSGLIIMNC